MQTFINKGKNEAYALALGGSIMDGLYFYVILSGLSFLNFSAEVIAALKIIGTLFIFVLGLREFLKAKNLKTASFENPPQKTNVFGLSGFFFLGLSSTPQTRH